MQERTRERNYGKQDCMSLEGFCRYMRFGIQQKLGNHFQVIVQEIVKNNDVKEQELMILEEGFNIAPNIHLELYYNDYVRGKVSLAEAEHRILKCYYAYKPEKNIDVSLFSDWEKVKRRVVYKLVNSETNRELLKDIPHQNFLDLMIVPYYLLKTNGKGMMASMLIRYEHLQLWGVTEQEVFEMARENTQKLLPCEIQCLGSLLEEQGECMGIHEQIKSCLYILTNPEMTNGAVTMIYPGVLSAVASKLNRDLYILPSSVNEVILLPAYDYTEEIESDAEETESDTVELENSADSESENVSDEAEDSESEAENGEENSENEEDVLPEEELDSDEDNLSETEEISESEEEPSDEAVGY